MNTTLPSSSARKVGIVTGAGKRLGRAIALGLGHAGWDIAVHYNTSQAEAQATVGEIQALGSRAAAFQCDLACEQGVRGLVNQVSQSFGPIGCIINSASMFEFDDTSNFSFSALESHMRTNVAAPILLARALYDATPETGRSVVVNLLDQKLFNMNPDFLSYTLSKSALHTATTMLAQELAPRVRLVGIAPGLTLISHIQTIEEFNEAHALAPLGSSSTPEDITSAVIFAVTNQALTGTTIVVDGGQHLVPMQRDFSFLHRK